MCKKHHTCNAIFRQATRNGGLSVIRLQTALRPCVTRSPLCVSLLPVSTLPGEHNDSNNLITPFGIYGASPSNLVRDLSEAGKVSFSVSACKHNLREIIYSISLLLKNQMVHPKKKAYHSQKICFITRSRSGR